MEGRLIDAVRNRRILYDTTHSDYMKTKLKTKTWDSVAKELDLPSGSEAKILWEKLRHSFRDALRRQQKCIRSGAMGENMKLWKYQKQMAFLQSFMTSRARDSNLNDDSDDSEQLGSEDGGEEENTEQEVTENTKKLKTKSAAALLTQSSATHEERAKHMAEERRRSVEKKATSDHLYHFFMSMYKLTKKMPPLSQHIVRNNVYHAVAEMEATLLNVSQTYEPAQSQLRFHMPSLYSDLSCSLNQHAYNSSPAPSHSSQSDYSPYAETKQNKISES